VSAQPLNRTPGEECEQKKGVKKLLILFKRGGLGSEGRFIRVWASSPASELSEIGH